MQRTHFQFTYFDIQRPEAERLLQAIAAICPEKDTFGLICGFETENWTSWREDLEAVSKSFPGAIIEVTLAVPSADIKDQIAVRFRDGDSELSTGHYGRWHTMLTQRQEEKVYAEARKRYLITRQDLAPAAARHLHNVIRRITGREDCFLDVSAYFSKVYAGNPDDDEGRPVTMIHDDAEAVSTEDGDPVFLSLMDPPTIDDLVTLVEGIEYQMKAGYLKGGYDETTNIYAVTPINQ